MMAYKPVDAVTDYRFKSPPSLVSVLTVIIALYTLKYKI